MNLPNTYEATFNDDSEYGDEDYKYLKALSDISPMIQQLVPLDCMIGVADRDKFLSIIYGKKIKLPMDMVGVPIPESDAIFKAIKSGAPVEMVVPKEAFGFKFRSSAIPIKNKHGKIIGGIGMGFDLENSEKLIDIAALVATSSQQSSAVIEELAASATELVDHQISLQHLASQFTDQIQNTEKMLSLIIEIANTSKILGLNASIEAARVGDAGKGFTVVAKEIRKMADNSVSSVSEIDKILGSLKDIINEFSSRVNETVNIGQQQAAATEEISGAIQEMTSYTITLENVAKAVIG